MMRRIVFLVSAMLAVVIPALAASAATEMKRLSHAITMSEVERLTAKDGTIYYKCTIEDRRLQPA